MITRPYPRTVNADEVFTQETLDRLTTTLLSWQQGPGNLGALHLHPCWGETSVLTRRYQGQTIFHPHSLLRGSRRLFEATGDVQWRMLADQVVFNLLALQAPNGGFIHAAAEAEPAYVPEITCPIHQFMPVVALLEYARWEHAREDIKTLIRPAIDRHWAWSLQHLWRSGNVYQRRPLSFPGWCGVTNQDLVAIAALALYARTYEDPSRYIQFGRPSLDVYLSSRYYYPQVGLMERGDNENFVERTAYYAVILYTLNLIKDALDESALQAVVDNVSRHLGDALFTGPDSRTHLSWGAKMPKDDKPRVEGWIRAPLNVGHYAELLPHLKRYLDRHPDSQLSAQVVDLEKTLASYVFADGTVPGALGASDPIFAVVGTPNTSLGFWNFLIDRLGKDVCSPVPVAPLCIHRKSGALAWKTDERMWAIEKDGRRLFAGFKPVPDGIVVGPDEAIAGVDWANLDQCDFLEILP